MSLNLDQVQLSIYEESFFHFFLDAWKILDPRPLEINWVYQFLSSHLQSLDEKVIDRLPAQSMIINCPPSMGKTRIATEIHAAYLLARNPGLRIGICSFSLDISNKMNGEVRRLMNSPWYKKYFPKTIITDDRAAKISTSVGGLCETVSPSSATTSKHFSVIICDDFASAGQASSDTLNQMGIDYYENSLKSRLENLDCPFIWIGQKYHSKDIYSHLLSKPDANYLHIVLPALLADNISPSIEEIRVQYPEAYQCGTIDCNRLPLDKLKLLEEGTLPQVWSSQFMQENLDLTSVIFQSSWIPLVDSSEGIVLGHGKTRHFVIDPAAGGSDETAIGVFFVHDGCLYLEASYFHTYAWTKAVNYLLDILQKHKVSNKSKIIIENASSGLQLIPHLKEIGYNSIAISHEGKSKAQRMSDEAVLSPIMAGRFRVIRHQNSSKFLGQMCGPLKIRLEDGRDMGVYAVKHLMASSKGSGEYKNRIAIYDPHSGASSFILDKPKAIKNPLYMSQSEKYDAGIY